MKRIFGPVVAMLVVLALVTLLSLPALAQDEAANPAIIVTADGITAPEQLAAGIVTLTFQNDTEARVQSLMVRLNDGKTMQDFASAMQSGMAGLLATVTLIGTPVLEPASSVDVIYDLTEGSYVLFVGTTDGPPSQFMLTVSGASDPATEAPAADVELNLSDTGLELPESVASGELVWQIANQSEATPYEFVLYPAEAGASVEDAYAAVQAALSNALGDPSLEPTAPVLHLSPLGPGVSAWVSLDLAPGSYLVLLQDVGLLTEIAPGMAGMLTVSD
ncbi:MAG: hypothetical protein U0452_11810 [Anaerolineae bacterium]